MKKCIYIIQYTADIIQYCNLLRCQVSLKDIDSRMNRAIDRRLSSRILKQCFLTI